MLAAIPLMILPLIAYNVLAFSPYGGLGPDVLGNEVISVTMVSGAVWTKQLGDVVIVGAPLLLFIKFFEGDAHRIVVGDRPSAVDFGVHRIPSRIPAGQAGGDGSVLHPHRRRLCRPDRRFLSLHPFGRTRCVDRAVVVLLPRRRGFCQPDPVADAVRDRLVVEIVTRVMKVGRVAVADEDERAGPGLQHEGEILAAHGRRDAGIDVVGAGDVAGDRHCEVCLVGMVEGDRVALAVAHRGFGIVGVGDVVDDLRNALFGHGANLGRQGTHAVPASSACSGMMLKAVPAFNLVMETTMDSSGFALREAINCIPETTWAPMVIGSIV